MQIIMDVSGKTVLIIVVIVSIQACLLHAKSLRGARQSAETINSGGEDQQRLNERNLRSVDSSCSPSQDQVEQYRQLLSTAIINDLSGNTMYYALRAVEAHNNRSVSATTAQEDNAIISSITDQTRFAPAGMETANKVICAKILQEMDEVASVISNTAVCPWIYYCDYKADRFPNYMFKARCRTASCSGDCSQEDNIHNTCQAHGIHVTVLQMSGNCGEWAPSQEILPIACTCGNNGLK